jgi:hypothetical protein
MYNLYSSNDAVTGKIAVIMRVLAFVKDYIGTETV